MRYQLSNGERGKNSRKNAKQSPRLENRGSAGIGGEVRHKILANGTSHAGFRHPNGRKIVVPVAKPIKTVYIKQFLALLVDLE
jgi:hypothetical protein